MHLLIGLLLVGGALALLFGRAGVKFLRFAVGFVVGGVGTLMAILLLLPMGAGSPTSVLMTAAVGGIILGSYLASNRIG